MGYAVGTYVGYAIGSEGDKVVGGGVVTNVGFGTLFARGMSNLASVVTKTSSDATFEQLAKKREERTQKVVSGQ